jgi:hypothetical protein
LKAPSCILAVTLTLVAAFAWAPAARSQVMVPIDTVTVQGRTAWEDGFLSLMDLDRVPQGSRVIGMGGAGMALVGGVEATALNPAVLTGIRRVELESEAIYYSGGASVSSFPQGRIGSILSTADYKVSPSSSLGYNNVTLGIPLVIFGSQGGLGLSYRRVARTGQAEETRAQLFVVTSSNQAVTYGRGDSPEGGMDAFTLSVARQMGERLSVGANLNLESGTLTRSEALGVSLYGFTIMSAGSEFTQDVSSSNFDLGARADLGRLKLAATTYVGHDMKFEGGSSEVRPLPEDQTSDRYDLRSTPLDNTLSVPTMFGFGSAFEVNDRLTLAADYMIRPWSKAEITRAKMDYTIGFADPADSSSFFYGLGVSDTDEETFSARIEDTNSLRLGLEYRMIQRQDWSMPVRLGFRKEKLTLSNTEIPDIYTNPVGLVNELYHLNLIPADQRTSEEQARYEEIDGALREVLEFNNLIFRGKAADATVISFGLGFEMGTFGAELAVERKAYDIDNFFLSGFNPDPRYGSLTPLLSKESRSIMAISLSTRWRF